MPQNVHQTTFYIENPQLLGISLQQRIGIGYLVVSGILRFVFWWCESDYALSRNYMYVCVAACVSMWVCRYTCVRACTCVWVYVKVEYSSEQFWVHDCKCERMIVWVYVSLWEAKWVCEHVNECEKVWVCKCVNEQVCMRMQLSKHVCVWVSVGTCMPASEGLGQP